MDPPSTCMFNPSTAATGFCRKQPYRFTSDRVSTTSSLIAAPPIPQMILPARRLCLFCPLPAASPPPPVAVRAVSAGESSPMAAAPATRRLHNSLLQAPFESRHPAQGFDRLAPPCLD